MHTHQRIDRDPQQKSASNLLSKLTATYFADEVLVVLAEHSQFRAEQPVAMDVVVDDVLRRSLTEAQIKDLGKKAVARKVQFAFRNQRKGYCGKRSPKTVQVAKGIWALTQEGLDHVRGLGHHGEAMAPDTEVPPVEVEIEPETVPVHITVAPWLRERIGDIREGDDPMALAKRYLDKLNAGYTLIEEADGYIYLDAPGTNCPACEAEGCEVCGDTGIAVHAQFKTSMLPVQGTGPAESVEVQETEPIEVQETSPVESVEVQSSTVREQNATTKHIEYMIREKDLLNRMCKKLAKKLPRSKNMDEILEFVNDYLVETMEKDRFQKYLEQGRPITVGNICTFALRRAYSKFRDASRDAHERTVRLARTASERREDATDEEQHAAVVAVSVPSDIKPIYSLDEKEEARTHGNSGTGWVDMSDGHDWHDRMIHHVDKMRGLDQIERTIRRVKAGAPERYVGLFHKECLGMGARDLAQDENVSPNRAATLKADLRTALKAGRRDAEVSRAILEYLCQEPWATGEEIADDFEFLVITPEDNFATTESGMLCVEERVAGTDGRIRVRTREFDPQVARVVRDYAYVSTGEDIEVASDLGRVLTHLVESGWLEARFDEAARKSESGLLGSYCVTRRGKAFVDEARDDSDDVPMTAMFLI